MILMFTKQLRLQFEKNFKTKTFSSYPIEPALRFCMTLLKSVPGTE